jgi:hypothetical protein
MGSALGRVQGGSPRVTRLSPAGNSSE